MNIVLQLTIRTKTPQDTLSSCLEHCPLTTFHWQLSCPSSYFFVRKLLCKKRTNSITIFHFPTRLTSIAEKPKKQNDCVYVYMHKLMYVMEVEIAFMVMNNILYDAIPTYAIFCQASVYLNLNFSLPGGVSKLNDSFFCHQMALLKYVLDFTTRWRIKTQ